MPYPTNSAASHQSAVSNVRRKKALDLPLINDRSINSIDSDAIISLFDAISR